MHPFRRWACGVGDVHETCKGSGNGPVPNSKTRHEVRTGFNSSADISSGLSVSLRRFDKAARSTAENGGTRKRSSTQLLQWRLSRRPIGLHINRHLDRQSRRNDQAKFPCRTAQLAGARTRPSA